MAEEAEQSTVEATLPNNIFNNFMHNASIQVMNRLEVTPIKKSLKSNPPYLTLTPANPNSTPVT